MKKRILLAALVASFISSFAQKHSFRFFAINDTTGRYQNVLGSIHSKIFLTTRGPGVDLFVYDTVAQMGEVRKYEFPRMMQTTIMREKSIAFVGAFFEDGKLYYKYLELDENGDSLRGHNDLLTLPSIRPEYALSPDKKHLLYFQSRRLNGDSALLQGTMIGVMGTVEKTLSYSFKHDKERDDFPSVFVDDNGNTHVLVFDKFDNYRLSTDLTINTVPFDEEAIISEAFALRKTKLKTVHFFQDSSGRINAQGLYADGQTRSVKGLYNIVFPMARKNEVRPKFFAFGPDLVRAFGKNFSATNTQVLDGMRLENFVNTDSGAYAVFRIDRSVNPNAGGYYLNSGNPRSSLNPGYDPGFTTFPRQAGSQAFVKLLSRANYFNTPKLVYLRMNKNHEIEWHVTRGLDVFNTDFRYNRQMFAYDKQDFVTLTYKADKWDDPQPVLVSFSNGRELVENLPQKYLTFSPLRSLSPKTFGSMFFDPVSGDSGIMLIQSSGN